MDLAYSDTIPAKQLYIGSAPPKVVEPLFGDDCGAD